MSGSWTAPVDISTVGFHNPANLILRVAFDGNGNALGAWTSSQDESYYQVNTAVLPANGVWTEPSTLFYDLYTTAQDIAVDALGDAFIAYMQTASLVIVSSYTNLASSMSISGLIRLLCPMEQIMRFLVLL